MGIYSKKSKNDGRLNNKNIHQFQNDTSSMEIVDNRPEAVTQKKIQMLVGDINIKQTGLNCLQRSRRKKDVDRDMRNVMTYSSLGQSYSQEEIRNSLPTNGVGGHRSGGQNDGMNSRTTRDLEEVTENLRRNRVLKKKRRKPKRRQERNKTNFEKALVQAETTFDGNLEGFNEYLFRKGWFEDEFSAPELEELRAAVGEKTNFEKALEQAMTTYQGSPGEFYEYIDDNDWEEEFSEDEWKKFDAAIEGQEK